MGVYRYQATFVLTCALSACSSAPGSMPGPKPDAGPYWSDPRFDAALFKAVQSAVHYPDDVIDQSLQSIRGTVQFTIVDGKIQDPQMDESTGHPGLDEIILRQVASASIPRPTGPYATEAHGFSMELGMPTAFESAEYAAIDSHKVYPKDPILAGHDGQCDCGFRLSRWESEQTSPSSSPAGINPWIRHLSGRSQTLFCRCHPRLMQARPCIWR